MTQPIGTDTEGLSRDSGAAVHVAFLEKLAHCDPDDRAWQEAVAGLVVLRIVDHWLQPAAPGADVSDESFAAADAEIRRLEVGSEQRALLSALVARVRRLRDDASEEALEGLCRALWAYGRALEDDADWGAALDVYRTALRVSDLAPDPLRLELAGRVELRIAFTCRELGASDEAAAIYARVRNAARAAGWREGELRCDFGETKIVILRGDLPDAEQRLADLAERAGSYGIRTVQAMALHELGTVLGRRGRIAAAVTRLFDAYRLTPPSELADRYQVLCDIALGFSLLGLRDAARHMFVAIVLRAPRRRARWVAALNLMQIARQLGDLAAFDHWRAWLQEQAMRPPELLAGYNLEVGYAGLAFGRFEESAAAFSSALNIAEKYGYGELVFEAEAGLDAVCKGRRQVSARPLGSDETPGEMEAVAEIASVLRAEFAAT